MSVQAQTMRAQRGVSPTEVMHPEPPLRALPPLAPELFARLQRKLVLDHCKWDPQVGDESTLAPFPLLLAGEAWQQLATWAEQLAAEAQAAEREILQRPELWPRLALPAGIGRVLGPLPPAPRLARFDFHWTTEGWRISEMNSDVPGGFTEASSFTQLMAGHYPAAKPAGDPAAAWVEAIVASVGGRGRVGLLAAPGYPEDLQLVTYLARRLEALGVQTIITEPRALRWHEGVAHFAGAAPVRLDAVLRFYQGEWLSLLPRRLGWSCFFGGARTPVTNAGHAILVESKRFPLVWDDLRLVDLPTWRRLLPETLDPREAPWREGHDWVLKSAYCNTGDTVTMREASRWSQAAVEVTRHPERWIAQRRFQTVPLATPLGSLHPCIGVYTLDGRAAGIYGRLSRRQVVDFQAIDCAVLVEGK